MMKSVLIAAIALGVAAPGVAAAQYPSGYPGGYQGAPSGYRGGPGDYYRGDPYRDGYRFHSRHEERRWEKERRREERERRHAWERAHRHGYGYGYGRY